MQQLRKTSVTPIKEKSQLREDKCQVQRETKLESWPPPSQTRLPVVLFSSRPVIAHASQPNTTPTAENIQFRERPIPPHCFPHKLSTSTPRPRSPTIDSPSSDQSGQPINQPPPPPLHPNPVPLKSYPTHIPHPTLTAFYVQYLTGGNKTLLFKPITEEQKSYHCLILIIILQMFVCLKTTKIYILVFSMFSCVSFLLLK